MAIPNWSPSSIESRYPALTARHLSRHASEQKKAMTVHMVSAEHPFVAWIPDHTTALLGDDDAISVPLSRVSISTGRPQWRHDEWTVVTSPTIAPAPRASMAHMALSTLPPS